MIWVSGIIVGLFGSLHCLGMCGPIAMILPVDRSNSKKQAFQTLLYHLGRIISYSLMGLIFGFVGKTLNLFTSQQYLSLIIGALMMISVFIPLNWSKRLQQKGPLSKLIRWVSQKLGQLLKEKRDDQILTLGVLNGLLPCGLVYIAIASATALSDPIQSTLYMAMFGVGTIPMMTTAVYLSQWISQKLRTRLLKWIPVLVFIMGALLFARGLNLGIKFISPKKSMTESMISSNYSCQ